MSTTTSFLKTSGLEIDATIAAFPPIECPSKLTLFEKLSVNLIKSSAIQK